MDCTLLKRSAQPATSKYLAKKLDDLRSKGYSENEIVEVRSRAFRWITDHVEEHPVIGSVVPMQKDIDRAITETLDDSIDIAAGLFA